MTGVDLPQTFHMVEKEVGLLSELQRILLGTDGSVTTLLEIITGNPVDVTTLLQEVIGADEVLARDLEVKVGDKVNHRVVELKNRSTGDVLIYAISYTPLHRLQPAFKSDLMRADIPIGKIILKHRIEARREIVHIGVMKADATFSKVFRIYPNEPLLSRRYHIIHRDSPLISIQEIFPHSSFTKERHVIVEAPSRLHLGLIDMNGSLGRVDGGIGIALSHPCTLIEVCEGEELTVRGGNDRIRERVKRVAATVMDYIGLTRGVEITIHNSIQDHVGLGSGTSLSLSTAAALTKLAGRTMDVTSIAQLVGRGGTSGIGTGAFEFGGFLIDGGHSFGKGGVKTDFRPSAASEGIYPARIITRHPFPEDWRILLIIPNIPRGASGRDEVDIFRAHCPIPIDEVREICHEVLIRMLPGIVEHDLDLFGTAINRLQMLGFKRVEIEQQPPVIPSLLATLRDAGAAGAGMSSFGPTIYAVADSGINDIQKAVREALGDAGGTITVTGGRNTGARIRMT